MRTALCVMTLACVAAARADAVGELCARLQSGPAAAREEARWALVDRDDSVDADLAARAAAAPPGLRWELEHVIALRRAGYTRAGWAQAGDFLAGFDALDHHARRRRLDEYATLVGYAARRAVDRVAERDPSPGVREHAAKVAASLDLAAALPALHGLRKAGNVEAAIALIDQLAARHPRHAEVHYVAARVLALASRIGPALDRIERAIQMGFDDVQRLEDDADLALVRREPRYLELIRRIQ